MKLQDDFTVIYADTKDDFIKLENTIKSGNTSELLKNKQYGIIKWERDKEAGKTYFSLVTEKILKDVHDIKKLPPTAIITVSSKDKKNKNYAPIKASTSEAIVITDDEQLKGIISLEREKSLSSNGLPGHIDGIAYIVICTFDNCLAPNNIYSSKRCRICGSPL